MTDRERIARLLHEHNPEHINRVWDSFSERERRAYFSMADAVTFDRIGQHITAVEQMEARVEAAEFERDRWKANYEKLVKNLSSIPPTREEPRNE